MIRILMGSKGMGKTKTLITWLNEASTSEEGKVVCVVKDDKYNHSTPRSIRLINSRDFDINGANEFYGFLCGIISMNFDVSHIFIDSISTVMKVTIKDIDLIIPYLKKLEEQFSIDFTVLISGDVSEATDVIKEYIV